MIIPFSENSTSMNWTILPLFNLINRPMNNRPFEYNFIKIFFIPNISYQ